MARQKKTQHLIEGATIEESLEVFSVRNMLRYATDVNLDRSIPDLYDGLKPVHRRILWAAANVAKAHNPAVKSLRIIGDTTAKYHVHGDTAVYESMVTLVQQPLPPMFGDGNWGTLTDIHAAARYTNSRLSNYGATMFDPDYLNKEVTNFVPNYDDKDIEPVVLPVQLPNLMLNGVDTGIGVGVATRIPAFTLESVLEVLMLLFKGRKLKPRHYAEILKPALKWGGRLARSAENEKAWEALFTSPVGRVKYVCDTRVSFDGRCVVISGWPPGIKADKLIEKFQDMPEVDSAELTDSSGGIPQYTITMKRGYNKPQFEEWAKKVKKLCAVHVTYRINVTERTAKTVDGVTTFDTQFKSLTIPELFERWVELRTELEVRSLQYLIKKTQNAIAHSKLLIYAVTVLDVIFASLKSKDATAYLVKNTKMNETQAQTILNMRVSQLSKMDDDKQRETLKEQQATLAEFEGHLAAPARRILRQIKSYGGVEFWRYEPKVSEG